LLLAASTYEILCIDQHGALEDEQTVANLSIDSHVIALPT
jgi:hypothetical protein